MSHIQMVGICRFSYPSCGTEEAPRDLHAERDRLYAPDRLALRFWFFQTLCLPMLEAQDDPDFRVIVMHGETMPPAWVAHLRRLVKPLPQLQLIPVPEGLPEAQVAGELLRAARDPAARAVGEFHLDDDDGLAPDFISACRESFGVLAPFWQAQGRAGLDFNHGLVVRGAERLTLEPIRAPQWGTGLTVFSRPRSQRTIADFSLRRIWGRMPMVTLPEPAMFLRGAHAATEAPVARTRHDAAEERAGEEILRRRFGFDPEWLRGEWARYLSGSGAG